MVAIRPLLDDPSRLVALLSDRDAGVEAARARVAAARAALGQAEVHPNPTLTGGIGGIVLGASNPPSPHLGLTTTTNLNLGVSEMFEIGKRGPRRQAASLRADEAGDLALAALGTRLGDGTAVLGKLAYVVARRGIVVANLETALSLEGLEKVRFERKDLAGVDFARIELDTKQLQLQLAGADSDVAVAVASCSATLLVRCTATELDDPTSLEHGAPLPAILPATEAAIEQRPARLASRQEIAALGADAVLADHRKIPDPTIGIGYTYDNLTVAGNQQQTLMLSLSIPLPLFDRGNHDAAAARANALALGAEDRAVLHESGGEVEALLAQRTTLTTTVATLETDAIPTSARVLDETRKGFDLGQTGLAELLLAERAHRELLFQILDARFQLFTVRVQLRQLLGIDDEAARAAGAGR